MLGGTGVPAVRSQLSVGGVVCAHAEPDIAQANNAAPANMELRITRIMPFTQWLQRPLPPHTAQIRPSN
ncbi:hypothetical protein [Sphingorhabdus contaminans]|uniref:hypothetical protein n=1 Tax=Sphingorhabdus contaminans TaxID=1343899 RepID=UPI003D2AADD6